MAEFLRPPERDGIATIRFGTILSGRRKDLSSLPIVVLEPAGRSGLPILGNFITRLGTPQQSVLFMKSASLLESEIDQVIGHLDQHDMQSAWRQGLIDFGAFNDDQIETSMNHYERYASQQLHNARIIRLDSSRRRRR